MHLVDYVRQSPGLLWFLSVQHASLVLQSVLIATVLALTVAALVYRSNALVASTVGITSVGLTVPSLALLVSMVVPLGLGVPPTVVTLVFFAALPIVRNAIVGLRGVDPQLVEAAAGIGFSRWRVLSQVEFPVAWPVILTGVRVSVQMVMGIAAVSAYVLGPGLGSLIFNGLARLGGANSVEMALTGTLLIVVIALLFDAALVVLGRLTTSRGLHV